MRPFRKLSSNAPSRTPFDAPNSILTALIVLVSLLSPSLLKLENTNSMVNKVVMCLGTNDVSKCKDDSDQVNVLFPTLNNFKGIAPKISMCLIRII
jgi:hypothetical protein